MQTFERSEADPGRGAAGTLRIRLFGELDLRLGDMVLAPLDSARTQSLLAYLLLHRDAPQPRQRLAFLLWPDSSEPQARTNLRHVLHNLRRALPDADRFLEATSRTLRWRADAPFWLDVAEFETALAVADDAPDPVPRLRDAAEAYGGDLLEGCYDDWLLEERDRLRELHLHALQNLASMLSERGERAEAVAVAGRMVRDDPLREDGYRLLMRLHDASGERARALRVYHECAAALERELGVAPSAETVAAYEALLPAETPAAVSPGRRPFVGRASERSRLAQLWAASERGRSQLVVVSGEPGIGKTRMVEELRSWCARRGVATAEARCYSAEGALAYGPVVAWLRSPALTARRRRLDRGRLAELARLLPELGAAPLEPLADSLQRQRLFDALAHAIVAPNTPLMLVVDDLHWVDGETLRFLHYLVRHAPASPLLVAATARREDIEDPHPLHDVIAGLQAQERCVEIELARLSPHQTALLAERLSGRTLDPASLEQLFKRTEGNPLFVVEALRAGSEGERDDAISPRVQAVIQSRLARLSVPARDLVGVAATIGREFTADVLAAAAESDDASLVPALDELWRRRIVRERGPDAYDFTHDRIREIAYQTLSPAQRRRTHLLVARALEQRGDDTHTVSGQLAAHYERAGAVEAAVSWYERAAELAARLYANVEAIAFLESALRLLETLPPGRTRDERELAIVTAALPMLSTAEGYSSERLRLFEQRGLEVADRLDIEPGAPLLRSVAMTALARSDFERSRRFAEQLRARGERDADSVLLVESDYVLGVSAYWGGRLQAAQLHLSAAVARYRPEHRATHVVRYGLDPKVVCLSRLGNTLWFVGRPVAATQARDAALSLAEEIEHPATASTARTFAAMLALESRDAEAVRRYAGEMAARSRELEVKAIKAGAEALAGYLDVLDGQRESGLARVRGSLEELGEAEHAPGLRSTLLRILAEACSAAGAWREGVVASELLLGAAGRVLWRAEALRLRAEFRAALGADRALVACELDEAFEVAHRQDARSLELRAATSLVRHRGGHDDRRLLADVLSRLPEPTATPDRMDAEALLERGTLAERPVAHAPRP